MGHFCSSTLLVCVSAAQTGKFVLQQYTFSLRLSGTNWKVYGTASVVRYVSDAGLSKCSNNFKVHYSIIIPLLLNDFTVISTSCKS